MKIFVRVVEEGGFAAAARALDVSPPVVTRVVADLEKHLGTRLLQRTTRKLALTEGGEAYLQRVRAILTDVDEAEAAAAASTRELRGTVRVLAPPVLVNHFLAPLVAPWHARYPHLHLDVRVDIFARERVDAFDVTLLVAGESFDGNLVARALLHGDVIVVASPDYLRRRGTPLQPDDLAAHDYLRDVGEAASSQAGMGRKLRLVSARDSSCVKEVEMQAVLQSVSTELLLRAAVDGAGLTVTSRLLAQSFLDSGQLVQLLPDWVFSRYTMFAALPSGRMLPARTRVFLDFLTDSVASKSQPEAARP